VGELSASSAGEETIVKQEDGTWLADGGVNIDDAAGVLGLNLPGDGSPESAAEAANQRFGRGAVPKMRGSPPGYHTLAGFILDLAGEIPRPGACFDYNGHRFKIVGLDGNRIDKIIISRIKK